MTITRLCTIIPFCTKSPAAARKVRDEPGQRGMSRDAPKVSGLHRKRALWNADCLTCSGSRRMVRRVTLYGHRTAVLSQAPRRGWRVMPLKYQANLGQCPDQPCPNQSKFAPGTTEAFRFMHRAATEDDFVPPASVDGIKPKDRCGRFALSFFDTLSNARQRFRKLAERVDAAARYGDHVGKIRLVASDGMLCAPDSRTGHFDLHQDAAAVFAPRVTAYFSASGDADAP